MEMSPTQTAALIFMAICMLFPSAQAQRPGRAKAPANTEEAEAKDSHAKAAELYEAGQEAHQKGDLEKAISLYGEALDSEPSMWQAEFQRGAAYFTLNRLDEAKLSIKGALKQLSEYADAPEAKAPSSRAQTMLGEIALAQNDQAEAEKSFRLAIEMNPRASHAYGGLAEIAWGVGKYADAIDEAKKAIEAGDDRATTYTLLGAALLLSGKNDEALASFNDALKRDPKISAALAGRAEINIARKELKAAIADLRATVEIKPDIQNRLRLAGVLATAKQYDEATQIYKGILQDEPSSAEAKTALATVLIESGKGAEAVAQLELLIKTEPNRADLRAQLAELYLQSQPEKALEQYQAAVKIEPSQPAHHIGVAASLVKLGKFQEAADAARSALALKPKEDLEIVARTNLATSLFKLDDFQNAGSEYIRILDYQSKRGDRKRTAITLYFIGICFDKLADYERALKAYDQFLILASPDNQLEIDKVNLRLPILKNQIKEGKGKKP